MNQRENHLERDLEMGNCLDSNAKSKVDLAATKPSSTSGTSTATNGSGSSCTTGQSWSSGGALADRSAGSGGAGGGEDESATLGASGGGRSLMKVFALAELRSATRNFKPDTVLGEGGFGTVFKGWVDEKTLNPVKCGSGMVIAVKKLNAESLQGFEEWQSEVKFLGMLSHPNLVRLLGYCWENKELLLVYEFMPKGSLENHLFRRGAAFEPLPWGLRLKIAIGAARGLAFLHSSEKQIIYRDFKASNILLDSDYSAKLSDFGLAKIGPTGSDTHVTTRVIGTEGYTAPEYLTTGHLYVKSDVYGFGVVLLEMLSGQRAVDESRPSGQQRLVEWAKPYLSEPKKLARLMDARLGGQYSSKGALHATELVLRCLADDPRNRPSMKEVLETLEKIDALKQQGRKQHQPTPADSGGATRLQGGRNSSNAASVSSSEPRRGGGGVAGAARHRASKER